MCILPYQHPTLKKKKVNVDLFLLVEEVGIDLKPSNKKKNLTDVSKHEEHPNHLNESNTPNHNPKLERPNYDGGRESENDENGAHCFDIDPWQRKPSVFPRVYKR